MKIEVERSGGFAGIKKVVTVDTDSLPKNVARVIEDYLSSSIHLKRKSKAAARKNSNADYYCYRVSALTEKRGKYLRLLNSKSTVNSSLQ